MDTCIYGWALLVGNKPSILIIKCLTVYIPIVRDTRDRDFMNYAKLRSSERSGNENVSTNFPWRRVHSSRILRMDFYGWVENLYRAERTKWWLSCKSCGRVLHFFGEFYGRLVIGDRWGRKRIIRRFGRLVSEDRGTWKEEFLESLWTLLI